MAKKRVLIYDTETTGVKIGTDRIVELAAYDIHTKATFSSLINPLMPIPEEASKITHITDDMVQDAPTLDIVMKQFIDFATPHCILVAHNNDSFDRPMLEAECRRINFALPSFEYFDTLKWSRKYRTDLPRHSLQYLREIYGIAENNAHRALDDVLVLAQIFEHFLDDLPIATAIQLLNEKPAPVRSMPFGKHKGIPLEKLPPGYLHWLKGSGALEKPENEHLKASMEQLGLLVESSS